MEKKVLLLNPPGTEIFIRDYYCSKVSKSSYIYTPVDLLIAGARLKNETNLFAIDAIASRLSEEQCLSQIVNIKPDTIISMTAAVSWNEDTNFFTKVKEELPDVELVVTGDAVMDSPEQTLSETPAIDAILTDFTTPEIIDFCQGERKNFRDIKTRNNIQCSDKPSQPPVSKYELPIPPHELFPLNKYQYPFVKRFPFATVLTDFGCPYKCTFCIQSVLEFKTRSVENVLDELKYLKSLGVKDIYFSDQTFGLNKKRAKKLLEAMIEEKFNFGWVAFYRVDLVEKNMIELMKKAGCHTLMFGIESASDETLKSYEKGISTDQVRSALSLCKSMDIRTVGTFILGFPDEAEKDTNRTIDYSLELPLDYASFNLPVPRSLTGLRKESVQSGIVEETQVVMDQSGNTPVMGTKHMSPDQLLSLRNKAIRRFYLRPKYIFKRFTSLRNWDEVKINSVNGIEVIKSAILR